MGSNLCRVKSGERLTRCTTVSWESIDEAFASLVLRRIGLQFNVEFWRYVEIDSGVDVLKPFVRFPLISIFINSNINSNQSHSLVPVACKGRQMMPLVKAFVQVRIKPLIMIMSRTQLISPR